MGKLVTPKVFLVGYSVIDRQALIDYLHYTNNFDFVNSMDGARREGLSDGEVLCSMYAKLCYKSLTLGKNSNVTRIRDIQDNLKGTLDQGHGSVWEHCLLNFIITDCSRVFTHELVRHRAGTAFSQTSGRYVRGDTIDIVFDPILDPIKQEVEELQALIEEKYNLMVKKMGLDEMKDFDKKKKATSALRRLLPNGQSNEIGFSVNLRALRHTVQVRTSRQAEWEIREVFSQVYKLVKDKFPTIFYGAKEEIVNDMIEVSGMKTQPY
jgi:thymidylate synthase (FAD)